jgi:putative hydrolase of the HAD superfamily
LIDTIILDLGKVLIDFDHLRAAERISNFCDKTPKQIFDLFFISEPTILFEEGKITPEDFFRRVKEILDLKLEYQSFVPIWNDIFFLTAKNRAVYSLANNLRAHYQVALLSNINVLHHEYLKQYFPVFNVFHRVFTSYEMGAIKPDQAIYKKALEELKARPENVFYTDDRQELVDSARDLGINSFLFTGVEQLKQDLASVGVTINHYA